MKRLFLNPLFFCIITLLFACNSKEDRVKNNNNYSIIDTLMNEQENAWNNADIEGFMEHYWKSDSLKFIGKSGISYGWNTTLNNYRISYDNVDKMGQLEFNNIYYNKLNNSTVLITGKWHLKRNDSLKDLNGYYTLIWKYITDQWKIIYDHSS